MMKKDSVEIPNFHPDLRENLLKIVEYGSGILHYNPEI